jgi:hypothetical protein
MRKQIFAAAGLVAAFLCGCAHHGGPIYHVGDENPPAFLTGPISLVLTNLGGFSAHVTCVTNGVEGRVSHVTGELLGRDGKLIFQPDLAIKGKRARTEGGLFYIWSTAQHSGFIISDALQSYAALTPVPDADLGTQLTLAREGIKQDVNGHPCHQCEAVVEMTDGRKQLLTLWQADDEKHFPVRIEMVNAGGRTTLDFSEIRHESPSEDLFLPPEGFNAYNGATAMMNELIIRDVSLTKSRGGGEFTEAPAGPNANWRDNTGPTQPGRQ